MHFHSLFQLQLMGLNGAFLTADLFNLFVFFEVLLAASYGLLLHGSGRSGARGPALHRDQPRRLAPVPDRRRLIYGVTGTLNMADLAQQDRRRCAEADRPLLHAGAAHPRRRLPGQGRDQEAHDHLAASSGQLLLFTSSSYTRGRAGYSLYSATKAGVVNLAQALADEWADSGIRVNCLNPQRTRTPMRTKAFGEEPADSLLDPEYVAAVALRVLESDLTGQVVDVRVASAPR